MPTSSDRALSSNSGPLHIRDVRNLPGREWVFPGTEWPPRVLGCVGPGKQGEGCLQETRMQGEAGVVRMVGVGRGTSRGSPRWPRSLPQRMVPEANGGWLSGLEGPGSQPPSARGQPSPYLPVKADRSIRAGRVFFQIAITATYRMYAPPFRPSTRQTQLNGHIVFLIEI